MHTTETAKSPSLFKAALVFAATAAMLALSGKAPAEELALAPRAYTGEPSVRIRGADTRGLNPVAFADWIAAHPRPFYADAPAAQLFARADADHDGRVSAVELKDLLLDLARQRQPSREG